MAEWDLIKKEFEETEISLAGLSTKYNIKYPTMKSRKKREDWAKKKDASKIKKDASSQKLKDANKKEPCDYSSQHEILKMENNEITNKQRFFVQEYLVDSNATQAAIRAGYSKKTAQEQGSRLLLNVMVQDAIQEAMKIRELRTEITVDKVLQELWAIAKADPNEIVELRRSCCRFCWGDNFKYQFTDNEMESRKVQYEAAKESASKENKPVPEFDSAGGTGFDATKAPNLSCPECFGEGINDPHFKDTRKLSPGAKTLYAGVKVGKSGIEVKMRSQDKALELVGKYLGMFKDKVELTGKDGEPLQIDMTNPEERRARIDALLARRKGT